MNTLTSKSALTHQARVSLHYADELSHAARMFGAATPREARLYPGGFNRPVVGRDPDYYSRAASKVFRTAIKSDPELSELYTRVQWLGDSLTKAITPPYAIAGPSVGQASELTTVAATIQTVIAEKDLYVPLSGKPLIRACAISSFALRVIDGTRQAYGDEGGLYPGLGPEAATNSPDYWLAMQSQLTTPTAE